MTHADEIQVVGPELCVWQAYEPAVKCDLTSAALKFGEQLVLIDPIALTNEATAELEAVGQPALIVCTSGNHARSAETFRSKYRIPIAAHPDAAGELGFTIDVPLEDGAPPPLGDLSVVTLPGAATGEIALLDARGILCVGDALIHLPPAGLAVLPEKYCADPKVLRASLQKLLRCHFRVLTFAHGWPLLQSAHQRLAALLS